MREPVPAGSRACLCMCVSVYTCATGCPCVRARMQCAYPCPCSYVPGPRHGPRLHYRADHVAIALATGASLTELKRCAALLQIVELLVSWRHCFQITFLFRFWYSKPKLGYC